MYCIVTMVRFVIILIKFYVCMYACRTVGQLLQTDSVSAFVYVKQYQYT